MRKLHAAWLLAPVGLLFAAWSLIVPVFEAPDEPAHWQFARYLHDHRSLPRYAAGFEEANSPPLYYLVIAPLAREAGSPSMVTAPDERGQPVSLAAPRTFLNTDADFARFWPIRAARLISVLMSVGTVWLSFLAGRAATGRHGTGLLAAILVALLPQFAFRGSQVSNDALVALLAAATTLGLVRLVAGGFTWRRGLWTAVALAGAYLSKISAIALVPPLALAVLAAPPELTWRRRAARLGVLAAALLIAFPWSLRNQLLYGDPFASGAMRTAVAHIITERSLFSGYFAWHFPLVLFQSFVGVFGWASLLLPTAVYAVFLVLGAAALAGLARAVRRDRTSRPLVLVLALAVLGVLAVVVHINLSFTQPQGRYLFPALPAMAVLAALGLEALPGRAAARPAALAVLLGGLNLWALLGVVRPAYYPAPARAVGPRERVLHPALLSDLAFAPATREMVVTGADPRVLVPADVDARAGDVLTFQLQGSLAAAAQTGCVNVATLRSALSASAPRCFDWRADGTPQRIRVDVGSDPGWTGRVTHLSIDPLDTGAAAGRGARLRLEDIRLVGAPSPAPPVSQPPDRR